ncbi:MAG: LD-carboxypeptidase [Chitinophagaceae bacterium]|nr:LD-carboxypeptidase [Chitinophagaceae bacterium]MBL0055857.1 LD-carboxypeptidase [Chitinophagaceae bacterium]
MKRKDFLSSVIPLGATLGAVARGNMPLDDPDTPTTIPPYLKKGDTIGITSPAGFIKTEEIQSAVNKITEWGFTVRIGSTIGKQNFTFGGTDAERRDDLQQLIDDQNVKAILCARGGYGLVRIIDELDFKKLDKHPKWIIGFSDITVLHSHLNRNTRIASIHSKMCNSFPDDWSKAEQVQIDSIESIRQCLAGEKMRYLMTPHPRNRTGMVDGELVGGNLKTIESLAGSKSDIHTRDKILFVEDTGEYLYSIDRMFWNLKRSGKLSKLKGLIIGGFKPKKDDPGEEFGLTLEDIVLEKVAEYKYPVCFDFPVGHQKNNLALKCGVLHRLAVHENECRLSEV